MPVVRGQEVKVTEQDVVITDRHMRQLDKQRVIAFIASSSDADQLKEIARATRDKLREMGAIQEKKKARLSDRALLRLYLNISPLFFWLIVITPIVLWLGAVYVRVFPWPIRYIFGSQFASQMKNTCPPTCTWHNLLIWAILGGIGLLLAVMLSHGLRKRLLNATQ